MNDKKKDARMHGNTPLRPEKVSSIEVCPPKSARLSNSEPTIINLLKPTNYRDKHGDIMREKNIFPLL